LLDGPFSNLDAKLRFGMRASLAQLHQRLGVTTVYVTHDQTEAMTLGQRVAVMRDGRILQVGSPQALYREPATLFVASFIGSPSMNLVRAELDGESARFGGLRVPLDTQSRPASARGQVILGIRPEDFHDASLASRALPTIEVTVALVEDLGPELLAFFPVDADRIAPGRLGPGDHQGLLADDRRALFCAKLDPATRARAGEPLTLAVDPARVHFFDAYDGARLQ
jgi:multiple sugar transport system ATP-binding protein